jgi:hypothetical protein
VLVQHYGLTVLQAQGHYALFNLGRALLRSLYPALLVALALAGALSAAGAVQAWMAATLAGTLLLGLRLRRAGLGRPQPRPALLRRYAGYGLRLHLGTLAELVDLRLVDLRRISPAARRLLTHASYGERSATRRSEPAAQARRRRGRHPHVAARPRSVRQSRVLYA